MSRPHNRRCSRPASPAAERQRTARPAGGSAGRAKQLPRQEATKRDDRLLAGEDFRLWSTLSLRWALRDLDDGDERRRAAEARRPRPPRGHTEDIVVQKPGLRLARLQQIKELSRSDDPGATVGSER